MIDQGFKEFRFQKSVRIVKEDGHAELQSQSRVEDGTLSHSPGSTGAPSLDAHPSQGGFLFTIIRKSQGYFFHFFLAQATYFTFLADKISSRLKNKLWRTN
ncbi:hypothetical protein K503DRAFT_329490 [Rhizopogon vinicolor AM-OR11-026]|uniref:Uncharacterized protein n=1 Tax=Rhizopogon vinicolor AM-OR11-026 TaxID=1314800 RepID=A0A1B7MU27_9AGAM|nr:hypothetical protein K503DRAFT_329490 [Rhizopogon vinicolor AM-OR11-026]